MVWSKVVFELMYNAFVVTQISSLGCCKLLYLCYDLPLPQSECPMSDPPSIGRKRRILNPSFNRTAKPPGRHRHRFLLYPWSSPRLLPRLPSELGTRWVMDRDLGWALLGRSLWSHLLLHPSGLEARDEESGLEI